MTILITGATGFVGRHLCAALASSGEKLRLAVRKAPVPDDRINGFGESVVVGDLQGDTDWRKALAGTSAVVHLASRVHVMNDDAASADALYQKTNVLGTQHLAEAALAAGIRHFVFISSAKAVGERGLLDAASAPAPLDAYGRSKLAAEQALHDVARGTGLALTVLRPPLVYGPGVGANFFRLLRLVDRRLPLPLANVSNQRSLVYVGNLVSAIRCVLEVSEPVGGEFFISDGDPVSTPDLIRAIAHALHKAPNLWPCPLPLLHTLATLATLAGKRAEISRLTESLVVDSDPFRKALDWMPPFTLQDGLRETIDWYSRRP